MNDGSLPALFAQLNTSNENQIGEACSKIRERFAGPEGLDLLLTEEVHPFLSQGLQHPNEVVQRLTLEQLLRLAKIPNGIQYLIKEQFLTKLLQKLRQGGLATYEPSNKVLLAVAASEDAAVQQALFSDKNMELLQEMVQGDQETIKFRALELVTQLSAVSPTCLERVRHFLDSIIELLRVNDVLQQLNVVQLVEGIANSKQGADYLFRSGIYEDLTGLVLSDDPMISLLVPSVFTVFGNIVKKEHVDFGAIVSSKLFAAVHRYIKGDDSTCEEAAIVAVGALGHPPKGISVLLTEHSALLRTWLHYSQTTNVASRITFLHSLADLLAGESDETEKVASIFGEIAEKTLVQTVMKFLEQPFEEQRYATFSVIRSVASHIWGAKALLEFPGFYEFLLNRGTETTKPGVEWKYSIIEVMAKSKAREAVKAILGESRFLQLTMYLREGVFYVQGESRVLVAAKSGF